MITTAGPFDLQPNVGIQVSGMRNDSKDSLLKNNKIRHKLPSSSKNITSFESLRCTLNMITLEKVEREASKGKRFLNRKKLVLRMNFGVRFRVYLEKLTTLSLIKQTFIKIKHSLEYIVNQSKFSVETIIIISSTKTKEYLRKKKGPAVK